MDRGAWWVTVHRVTKSWTRLKRLGTAQHWGFGKQVGPEDWRKAGALESSGSEAGPGDPPSSQQLHQAQVTELL